MLDSYVLLVCLLASFEIRIPGALVNCVTDFLAASAANVLVGMLAIVIISILFVIFVIL